MANTDLKYGEVTTEFGNFIDGEPVFVFRARDSQLPDMLRNYRAKCQQAGSPQYHLATIDENIARIEEWQVANLNEVIVPKSDGYRARKEQEQSA
jgi:hypothetical protein